MKAMESDASFICGSQENDLTDIPNMTSHLTENQVVLGDNLELLKQLPDESFQLIYIDPPFNTGKKQSMARQTTVAGEVVKGDSFSYEDAFDGDSFLEFIQPRLKEAHRLLKPSGTIYIHLDYREVHYVKVMADTIFGRQNFLNEIIWSYDYGGKAKNKWPAKHDNILVYVKDIKKYAFDSSTVDRIPYMAPGLAGPEKAALGKRVTDSWFITIAPTQGPERTGYPTQKPVKLLQRIIRASSVEGDWVLDFFAGSGTTAAVAGELGRKFVTVDQNPESFKVVQARLTKASIPFVATEL